MDTPQLVPLSSFDNVPDWLRDAVAPESFWARVSGGAKQDEKALWAAIQMPGATPRAAGWFLGMPPRRVRYLCEKWARRRIYEYGTVYDLGWPVR